MGTAALHTWTVRFRRRARPVTGGRRDVSRLRGSEGKREAEIEEKVEWEEVRKRCEGRRDGR